MTFLNKLKKFGKKITNTVDKLEEKYEVSEKFDNIKDKAGDIIDDVKDKASDLNKEYKITDKLEDAKDKVVDVAGDVKENIEARLEDKITFDDFAKVELKLGKILEAEEVKKSKKLYKLKVDFGEEEPRQILSGIKEYYKIDDLMGKKVLFATNLLPRKIMGEESNGMILGLQGEDEFSLLIADRKSVKEGVQAG
jgi:methionyl-tRNA synthetase